MSNKYRHVSEPHLLGYYFSRDSEIHDLIEALRGGVLNGGVPRFKESKLKAAESEIRRVIATHDESAYPFARDLSYHLIGGPRRMIALIEGVFLYENEQRLESIIGVDLGTNPWQVFESGNSRETIDSRATVRAANLYLAAHRDELSGIKGFEIAKSYFLYLANNVAAEFETGGEIDMSRLVPLITHTKHVGLTPVSAPSLSRYSAEAPIPITSYRLKRSLADKLIEKIGLPHISGDDVIRDMVGHRVVVENEQQARELADFLKGSPTIGSNGSSKVECIEYQDGYSLPERGRDFKALKITARVTVKGKKGNFPPTIRRIHIVDRTEYYRNEIDPKDRANHKVVYERQRRQRRLNTDNPHLKNAQVVLERLFGQPIGLVEVKSD